MHRPRRDVRGARGQDRRVARGGRPARPHPDGLPRDARPTMRVLHTGDADDGPRPARREPGPHRPRDPDRDLRRRSAAVPATRTSSAPCAGPRSTRPRRDGRHEHGDCREPSQPLGRAPRRLRPPEAQGGRALHPRAGHLSRRHPPAGDGVRRPAEEPVRARAHRVDRHLEGARPPQRRRGRHGQGPRDPRPGVDADDLLRHAGRARGRQGPLPGPGGRVRDRDRRVLGQRRAEPDRRRVRPPCRRS